MKLKKTVWKSRTTTQLYSKLALVICTSIQVLVTSMIFSITVWLALRLAYFCEVNRHFPIWIPPQPAQIATPTSLHLADVQSSKRDEDDWRMFKLSSHLTKDQSRSLIILHHSSKSSNHWCIFKSCLNLSGSQVDPSIDSFESRWIYNLV